MTVEDALQHKEPQNRNPTKKKKPERAFTRKIEGITLERERYVRH